MRETWIIVCYTSECSMGISKMFGTREEVQEKVFSMIEKDKEEDKEAWYSGTESVYDFDSSQNNGFDGYNNFDDYSIIYYACPYNDLQEMPKDWR